MPVPRRKKSKGRRNDRRSHIHLAVPKLQKCPRCAAPKMAHRVCASCGYYKDTEVVQVEEVK